MESENDLKGTPADMPPDTLRQIYRTMLRIRIFEEKAAELILNKEIICPTHLYIGQEAVATGVCAALRRDDLVFSTHRSHGHYIAKGGDLNALMAELFGRSTGCSRGHGGSMHLSSPDVGFMGSSAIVAGSVPLAVGAALSFSIRKQDRVAVAFFGDGAVNEGVWYESLNFASLRKLPVIFVCENNLYSTHMPVSECLADTCIYRKAEGFGMPGFRVDGNDVLAVYEEAEKAVQAARRGKGPTLMECMTYRWRGHVGPHYDLEKGLRSKEEVDRWIARCPIELLEKNMLEHNAVSVSEMRKTQREVGEEIDSTVNYAKESPYPDEKTLLNHVFKEN